ncbi:DUF4304 domain-containing protein [Sphingobacterium sp. HJSM2_6]|uniref:DUF4304 domain-containing protein n=1 Tax=Sphingobacterium sp. HJSM2_6 TaxID=3366264 RepID=UPI003BC912E8
MEKKDLIKLLDEIFVPLGFKRKGNNWVLNGGELSKLINLQKSNYSNAFYINYGYIIKGLDLTTTTHVENRLASTKKEEQKRITDLLDLETEIPTDQRLAELKKLITDKIAVQMQSVNIEADLLKDLKKRSHLNNIPLVVKQYFNLPE